MLCELILESTELFAKQRFHNQQATNELGVVRKWKTLSFRRFELTYYLCNHFLKYPLLGRKYFQNLKAKTVLQMINDGTHLSLEGRQTAFELQQASRNQVLPDEIRVNYVVKTTSRTRTTVTLDQMRYIDLRMRQGSNQSQIAREKADQGLSRYAIGRYLKDRDRYFNEELKAIKAQNAEVVAYVNKRLSQGVNLSQIKVELGNAWIIWQRATKTHG